MTHLFLAKVTEIPKEIHFTETFQVSKPSLPSSSWESPKILISFYKHIRIDVFDLYKQIVGSENTENSILRSNRDNWPALIVNK